MKTLRRHRAGEVEWPDSAVLCGLHLVMIGSLWDRVVDDIDDIYILIEAVVRAELLERVA